VLGNCFTDPLEPVETGEDWKLPGNGSIDPGQCEAAMAHET
jgi:hypothetical protein